MSETHEVETIWKEAGATLYDAYARAAANFIEHCDDLLEMFKFLDDEKSPDDKVMHELRAVRSRINSKVTEFQSQAEKLRASE
jgi:hypothetical protein